MKAFHPAIKILTATLFFALMFAFVAFKSGAFDGTRSAQLKLNVSRTGKSHHYKSKANNKFTRREKPKKDHSMSEYDMMASSKVIVASPVDWSRLSSQELAMMAGSKSAGVISAPASSVYGGVFSSPYLWKAKSTGEQLKQGKSKWNN